MHFELVDAITDKSPARLRNEDAFFFLNQLVVVLDGSTGLGKPVTSVESDANWFVNQLQYGLQQIPSKRIDLLSALTSVLANIEKKFDRESLNPNKYQDPSAGLVAVQPSDTKGIFYRVGDCKAFLKRRDEVKELFPMSPIEKLDNEVIRTIADSARSGQTTQSAQQEILDLLRENRSKMNSPGGYDVLTSKKSSISGIATKEVELVHNDLILLVSDGFWASVAVYAIATKLDVFSVLEQGRAGELVAKMRERETTDSALTQHPRLKQFDDATAVLLRVSFGEESVD